MKLILPTSRRLVTTLSVCLASWFCVLATAHAQTVIDSLPYTISTKGLYVLNNDLNSSQTSGNLITVNASNVTIDFQGHYIAGAVGNTSQTTNGIRANEQSNLTIKNGTIAYCSLGIYLTGNGSTSTNAVGAVVDSMRVTYCYSDGINVNYCPACRIANCQVSQTGYSGQSGAVAIYAAQSGAIVQNNTVSNVMGSTSYGIYAPNSFVRQNTVFDASVGIDYGKYQDNLTINCTTPYSNGTDAGGNN